MLISGHQRTIKNSVSCFGVGLHKGKITSLKLLPAEADKGIIFRRTDLAENNEILANFEMVSETNFSTTISNKHAVKVSTIEHLMAAFWGCGVDNIIVELDGEEVPIMDGSSEPFVFMVDCAGITEQGQIRKIIEVMKPIKIHDNDAYISLTPADRFSVSMEIDFAGTAISKQHYKFDSRDFSFKMDLCRARTFGFAQEVNKLRAMGLALGGSLENAIVVDGDKIINKEGLRYNDEFVRHKILDSIGDFYLAGGYIKGHFHGYRSGHKLNNKLLREFFADSEAWRLSTIETSSPAN